MSWQERKTQSAPRLKSKKRAGKKRNVISGLAAVFYDGSPATEFEIAPGVFERIHRNAFDTSIDRDDIRSMFNHDPNYLLGSTSAGTLRLTVDRYGLVYEVQPPDTTSGRDVSELVKRGDVDGSSFWFRVDDDRKYQDDGGRLIWEITSVTLREAGPVVLPAYEATTANYRSRRQKSHAEQVEAFRKWAHRPNTDWLFLPNAVAGQNTLPKFATSRQLIENAGQLSPGIAGR